MNRATAIVHDMVNDGPASGTDADRISDREAWAWAGVLSVRSATPFGRRPRRGAFTDAVQNGADGLRLTMPLRAWPESRRNVLNPLIPWEHRLLAMRREGRGTPACTIF